MRLRLPLSLSLALLSWQNAGAQLAPADDFFHSGAQFYISNNIPSAKEQVEMGLKLYPDDEKLKKLEALLNQQSQQQQSQQNQSQQQKSDEKKDQQKQDQSSSQQNSQDQQNQSGQKKEDPNKPADPAKASGQKKDGEKPDEQTADGQPVKPEQMTPQEAKRLLDAQKGAEQFLQLKPTDKPRDSRRPLKDW